MPPNDKTPVQDMSPADANKAVAKDLGLTPAPVPDPNASPPPAAPVPKPVDPPVPDPNASPAPTAPPAVPPTLAIPKELLDKTKPADPSAPDPNAFDPNSIKIEEIPEPIRPNFAKMRDLLNGKTKDIETVTKERNVLQARIDSGETADPETLKKFKDKNVELQDQLGKLSLGADPRFIAKYDLRRKPILESVETMLASYKVDGMDVKKVVGIAASLGTQERMAFLDNSLPEEIKAAASSMVLPALAQLDIVEGSRQAELTEHETISASLKESQEKVDKLSIAALRESAKAAAMVEVEESEILLKRVEGNEEWNKTVDGLKAKIDTLFAANDPNTHAKALIESQIGPVYKHMFFAERAARETLEAALRQRNIILPGMGEKPPASASEAPPVQHMTADEAAKRATENVASKMAW